MADGATPVRPNFPAIDPNQHIRSIPACGAMGLSVVRTEDGGVACRLPALPAVMQDGRLTAGAALTLADQATAQGVFAVLPAPIPMMTLTLRIDWTGDLPGEAMDCVIEDVTREGALALVRGRLVAGERSLGTVTARYLIGAMPGGDKGSPHQAAPDEPVSDAADFADYLGGTPEHHDPHWCHVGARTLPAYHGGVIAALLDRAAAAAVPAGLVRADTDVRYLAPGRADRPMTLTPRMVRGGKRVCTIEVEARQDDGATLVAVGRMLFVGTALRDG